MKCVIGSIEALVTDAPVTVTAKTISIGNSKACLELGGTNARLLLTLRKATTDVRSEFFCYSSFIPLTASMEAARLAEDAVVNIANARSPRDANHNNGQIQRLVTSGREAIG
jgi:hypothetical protein